jgi:hypothetical protein
VADTLSGDSVLGEINDTFTLYETLSRGSDGRGINFRIFVQKLIGKSQRNRTLAVLKRGCEDNIKHLARSRSAFVNTAISFGSRETREIT